MLKATRTRLGSAAWLAVGLVMLIPALADAQLFPNRTIRREKPSCASEPPFYKQVRRDYFGYYPTCWSKFPAGWGCPCPDLELEAMRRDFKEKPPSFERVAPAASRYDREQPEDDMDRGAGNPNANPNPDTNTVDPPRTQSPFEMDTKPSTTPPPLPPGPGRSSGSAGPGASSSNLPANMELPSLPATSPTSSNSSNMAPGSMVTYPEEAVLASTTLNERPELGPLPTAPTPAPFTPASDSTTGGVVLGDSTTIVGMPPTTSATTTPAQAPKRKSLLSQLFSRNNTNTQNR